MFKTYTKKLIKEASKSTNMSPHIFKKLSTARSKQQPHIHHIRPKHQKQTRRSYRTWYQKNTKFIGFYSVLLMLPLLGLCQTWSTMSPNMTTTLQRRVGNMIRDETHTIKHSETKRPQNEATQVINMTRKMKPKWPQNGTKMASKRHQKTMIKNDPKRSKPLPLGPGVEGLTRPEGGYPPRGPGGGSPGSGVVPFWCLGGIPGPLFVEVDF